MREEGGQTTIEYGLVLAVIAGICTFVAAAMSGVTGFIIDAIRGVF